MSGSAIPTVLPLLAAKFAAVGVAGLTVSDGPLYDPQGHYVCVGWDRSGQPGVASSFDLSGARAAIQRDRETFDVSCLLAWWIDTNDIAAARDAAFAAFQQLTAALDADQTLGWVVLSARVTALDVTTDVEETGGTVDVRFTVNVDTLRSN